jgi:hypothetical protein
MGAQRRGPVFGGISAESSSVASMVKKLSKRGGKLYTAFTARLSNLGHYDCLSATISNAVPTGNVAAALSKVNVQYLGRAAGGYRTTTNRPEWPRVEVEAVAASLACGHDMAKAANAITSSARISETSDAYSGQPQLVKGLGA